MSAKRDILKKAIEHFANLYHNTGADYNECLNTAWTVYRRARDNGQGFYAAIDSLYFEAVRYADM